MPHKTTRYRRHPNETDNILEEVLDLLADVKAEMLYLNREGHKADRLAREAEEEAVYRREKETKAAWQGMDIPYRALWTLMRNNLTPSMVRSMTDHDVLRLRNIGPSTLVVIRAALEAVE